MQGSRGHISLSWPSRNHLQSVTVCPTTPQMEKQRPREVSLRNDRLCCSLGGPPPESWQSSREGGSGAPRWPEFGPTSPTYVLFFKPF